MFFDKTREYIKNLPSHDLDAVYLLLSIFCAEISEELQDMKNKPKKSNKDWEEIEKHTFCNVQIFELILVAENELRKRELMD